MSFVFYFISQQLPAELLILCSYLMATFESVMYGELSLEVVSRRRSWEYASHFIFCGGRQLPARVQKS